MRIRIILGLLLAALLAGVTGYLVLINPDNPLTRLFSRRITDTDSRIVVGPYPVERDFRLLQAGKVTHIVSLLDPALPYEKTLLEKERVLAAKYGMRLENFPMASVLGRKFGDYYEGNAERAAAIIAATSDKVYLHCYLGLHRIQAVRDRLSARGVGSATYLIRQAERDQQRRLLDAAEAAYNAGHYEDALTALARIPPPALTVPARQLQAWSQYRLGRFDQAAGLFSDAQARDPANADSAIGAGYSELRRGRAAAAEERFSAALRLSHDNAEALGGLGLAQFQEGKAAEAAKNIEASLLLAPNNAELRDVLARLQAQPAR
jgi:tetratricopeptide (TPR) repeat protein